MAVQKRHVVSRDLEDARLWHASHHRSLERRARSAAPRRRPHATLAVVVAAGAALAPAAALAAPATGGPVAAAQKALGIDADGVLGPQTRRAIRRFQRSHGLPVTGRLDAATQQALGGGGDGETAAPGMTLREGQQALGIKADGRMGPATRAALKSFQEEHGLPATGRFDAATQQALMKGGAATPRSAAPDNPAAAPATPASGVQAAVDAARAQIGAPYASGGRGPGGFDCSGLTRYAFKQAGISLGASSFDQYGQGTAVDKSQIQPGDLVFFNTAGSGASHVGVATSPTSMISATSHGVMEASFSSGYWASHYVGARRVTA